MLYHVITYYGVMFEIKILAIAILELKSKINWPVHRILILVASASSEGSGKSAHTFSDFCK